MSHRAKKRDKEQRALDDSDWEKRRLAAGVDPQHMMLPKRKDTDLAYRERVMEDETTLDLEKRRTSMEDRIDRDAMYVGISQTGDVLPGDAVHGKDQHPFFSGPRHKGKYKEGTEPADNPEVVAREMQTACGLPKEP